MCGRVVVRGLRGLLLVVLFVMLLALPAVAQPQVGTEKNYDFKFYVSAEQNGEKSELTCSGSITIKVKDVTEDVVKIDYNLVIDKCDFKGNKTILEQLASEADLGDMLKALEGKKYVRNETRTYSINEEPDPYDIKFYVDPAKLPEDRTIKNTTSESYYGMSFTLSSNVKYDKNGLLEEAHQSMEVEGGGFKGTVRVDVTGKGVLASIIYLAVIAVVVLAIAGGLVFLARRI